MTEPEQAEFLEVTLRDGTQITMRRDEDGATEICTPTTCLALPAQTAGEFLAIHEFFKHLGEP